MSTRSIIGICLADGTYHTVYCHFDGYLSGVGQTLFKNYRTEKQVLKLLSNGDMSSLREEVDSTEYYKDKGEDLYIKVSDNEIEAFGDRWQEYEYLFNEDKWWYRTTYKDDNREWKDLKTALINEKIISEEENIESEGVEKMALRNYVWQITFLDGDTILCKTAEKAYEEMKDFIYDTQLDEKKAEEAVSELTSEYEYDETGFGLDEYCWAQREELID